ncbi:hypothetical protein Back11_56240 [Paenibacillus baekrokdamisoli]|uniref:Uncharacterized protein n=1 Tax=Paenibacillus baekrokdamisoli TaxID=1712516 RepID=A0A3G9JML0_9BACL|nr:hypothetical protein Back11_56240 [Paenibacillus baekrokdamisoli]
MIANNAGPPSLRSSTWLSPCAGFDIVIFKGQNAANSGTQSFRKNGPKTLPIFRYNNEN